MWMSLNQVVPDVSVEQRPEPEQSSMSLNEYPTQMVETAPINSESKIKERNLTSNERSHTDNTQNEESSTEFYFDLF